MDALTYALLILAGIAIGLPVLAGSIMFWLLLFTTATTPQPSPNSPLLDDGTNCAFNEFAKTTNKEKP